MIAIAAFIAVACSAVSSVEGGDDWYTPMRCSSQEECPPGSCCSKKAFHDEAYCVNYRKENEICLDDMLGSTMINGLWEITCPCDGDMKCIHEDARAPNGFIYSLGLPRCRKLRSSGSRNFASTNSFAQANSGGAFGGPGNAFAQTNSGGAFGGPGNAFAQTNSGGAFGGPGNAFASGVDGSFEQPFVPMIPYNRFASSAASSSASGGSSSGSNERAFEGTSNGVSSASSSSSSSGAK